MISTIITFLIFFFVLRFLIKVLGQQEPKESTEKQAPDVQVNFWELLNQEMNTQTETQMPTPVPTIKKYKKVNKHNGNKILPDEYKTLNPKDVESNVLTKLETTQNRKFTQTSENFIEDEEERYLRLKKLKSEQKQNNLKKLSPNLVSQQVVRQSDEPNTSTENKQNQNHVLQKILASKPFPQQAFILSEILNRKYT